MSRHMEGNEFKKLLACGGKIHMNLLRIFVRPSERYIGTALLYLLPVKYEITVWKQMHKIAKLSAKLRRIPIRRHPHHLVFVMECKAKISRDFTIEMSEGLHVSA